MGIRDNYTLTMNELMHDIYLTDLNTRDVHGQTIMHEIAREWNTDVAKLLHLKGMEIDLEDKWGRTPLFVAVASNHVTMVKWLIDNGGNLIY